MMTQKSKENLNTKQEKPVMNKVPLMSNMTALLYKILKIPKKTDNKMEDGKQKGNKKVDATSFDDVMRAIDSNLRQSSSKSLPLEAKTPSITKKKSDKRLIEENKNELIVIKQSAMFRGNPDLLSTIVKEDKN
jgi:hypothetical protein